METASEREAPDEGVSEGEAPDDEEVVDDCYYGDQVEEAGSVPARGVLGQRYRSAL